MFKYSTCYSFEMSYHIHTSDTVGALFQLEFQSLA